MSGFLAKNFRLLVGELFQTECLECGVLSHGETFCGNCFPFPLYDVPWESIQSAFWLSPAALRFIHEVKFGGWVELIAEINPLISKIGVRVPDLDWTLIPVPLSRERLLERGFNQSHILAKTLSRSTGLPLLTQGLIKTKDTPPQSLLGRKERQKNLRDVFEWKAGVKVPKQAVLVDDVFTTGETMKAAMDCLRREGVLGVRGWTLFRTPQNSI